MHLIDNSTRLIKESTGKFLCGEEYEPIPLFCFRNKNQCDNAPFLSERHFYTRKVFCNYLIPMAEPPFHLADYKSKLPLERSR